MWYSGEERDGEKEPGEGERSAKGEGEGRKYTDLAVLVAP